MNISPFLTVNHSCDKTLEWATKRLVSSGLRSVQTFDLQTARVGMRDCPCPNHGMAECDCQMVILLVYGKTEGPVTLILHGNTEQTWFSIANNPNLESDTKRSDEIQQALGKLPIQAE